MSITAVLSWYDEKPSWLAATVASLAGQVDHLVAVDGAYAAFPGALRRPASPPEQAETILEVANAHQLRTTIHIPSDPWWGGEVEKRSFMFTLSDPVWWLVIDADETLRASDLREEVSSVDELGMDVFVVDLEDSTKAPCRRLLRNLPGMRYVNNHYTVLAGDGTMLLGEGAGPSVLAHAEIDHRRRARVSKRDQRRLAYYQQRDLLGLEKP